MKEGLHPPIYKDAKVTCTACGSVFTIPGTVKVVQIEICSNCHPVYTGKYRAVTGSGRVERFRKKVEAAKVATLRQAQGKKAKKLTEEEKFQKRVQEVSLERKRMREERKAKDIRKKIAEAKKIVVTGVKGNLPAGRQGKGVKGSKGKTKPVAKKATKKRDKK